MGAPMPHGLDTQAALECTAWQMGKDIVEPIPEGVRDGPESTKSIAG
jgi:hypothetical protein